MPGRRSAQAPAATTTTSAPDLAVRRMHGHRAGRGDHQPGGRPLTATAPSRPAPASRPARNRRPSTRAPPDTNTPGSAGSSGGRAGGLARAEPVDPPADRHTGRTGPQPPLHLVQPGGVGVDDERAATRPSRCRRPRPRPAARSAPGSGPRRRRTGRSGARRRRTTRAG